MRTIKIPNAPPLPPGHYEVVLKKDVDRLIAVLKDARAFVDRHSEDWYKAGRDLLKEIDEALKGTSP